MVQGAQVKVTGLVVGLGGGAALLVGLEEEELGLGTHVEGVIAHVVGLLQHPLENTTGIAHKGSAVGVIHVADQPGHTAMLGTPGEDGKAVQIGVQILVRLVDAHKALDGGAVQSDLVVQSLLNLGSGDGHILQLTENVGKLHANEVNILFLDNANDVFLGVTHCSFPFSFDSSG